MKKKPRYLIDGIYTADPRAHVYNGKLYVFPSHDIESGIPENDNGDHFDMKDFHVYSIDEAVSKATDHGVALDVKDVPWAERQMWSNDVAEKDGNYYMYFPAKDPDGIFHLGVAVADRPEGPYKAQPEPMKGSYSIDPSVFVDDDGKQYIYWGGIWGGQLQRWPNGQYNADGQEPADNDQAIGARVARLSDDMLSYGETPREIVILDAYGKPLKAGDHNRRFFEAPWMHKYKGKYYFSYSTGNTHLLCYAVGDNPYGPFTYGGVILTPVVGWTTHHSIVEYKGKWYLFHHDSKPSGGKTWLRSMKVVELEYNDDGSIVTIDGMQDE
ncbi:glycoside hydrolase family 43 protein [Roseimarinus sediminis]|uniref:glycoside hydrolase family 43 protein n=1 Tax=Roseimarinus sediminis TaxID=1610899 RepID=UPI003D247300